MMSPAERKELARKMEEYYRSTRGKRPPLEQPEPVRAVPLALRFDVCLTDADKIRLHAWGVAA